jgi:hypothetical protein
MKIRNKKRLSIIIASFMVVLVAGAAFALTAQGPLTWNGNVSVEASLLLAFDSEVYVLEANFEPVPEKKFTVPALFNNTPSDRTDGYYKTVTFTVKLDGTHLFNPYGIDPVLVSGVLIENLGSVPAFAFVDVYTQVTDPTGLVDFVGVDNLFNVWTSLQDQDQIGTGLHMNPEDLFFFEIEVHIDPNFLPEVQSNEVAVTLTIELIMSYVVASYNDTGNIVRVY